MRTERRRRVWSYLFYPTGAVLLLAILSFALVSVYALRRTAYRQTTENLRQFSYAVTHFLDAYPVLTDSEELQRFCAHFGAEPDFRITIIGPDGTVEADSNADPREMENHNDRPEVASALLGEEASIIRYSATLGKRLVYFAQPYRGYVVRLAVAVDYVDMGSRQILLVIVFAAALIMLLTLIVSSLVATRLVAPLRRLGAAAAEYSQGRLDAKLDPAGYPDEFAQLARAYSAMADSLREKMGALDGQNRETEAILASMHEALVVLDAKRRVLRINAAAELLFCMSAEDAVGLPLIQFVRNTDIVDFANKKNRSDYERAVELRTGEKEGSRWLLARSSDIGSEGGTLLVFHDITRLKRLERIRKDFVANVSHELKTPVTSIQGFIETLKDGALENPATARRFLDIMEQQSLRLSAIIGDLLTISRLEQEGASEISREPTNLAALFDDVVNLCADSARKKNTSIEAVCPKNLEKPLNAGLMEQALVNLAQNAVKYSPEGSQVRLSAEISSVARSGDENAPEILALSVADNGPGISERYQERIFERFYRIDKGRSRDQGGTGLGLSIVRHIALAHGGAVTLDSTEGQIGRAHV